MKIKIPKNGDKRIKERFLFFPKLGNGYIRWLEWAKWRDTWFAGCWLFDIWLDI